MAGGRAGGVPLVLVGEEEVFVFFPVALDGGGVGGRGGGSAIGVITLDVIAINYGDFAIIFFDELVELGIDAGAMFALVVRIVKDEDGGVRVAIDIFGEVARLFASGEDLGEAIFGRWAVNDTKADDAGKGGDNDCNNDPSFPIHETIIARAIMSL